MASLVLAHVSSACVYSECPAPDPDRRYDVGILVNGEFPRTVSSKFSVELDAACEVRSKNRVRLELSCPPVAHTSTIVEIVIDTEPPLETPFAVGEELRAKVFVDSPWWSNVYFALSRKDESVVLVGADAASLMPPSGFFGDWELTVLPGACRLATTRCVSERHQVVELSTKDGAVQIPSGAAFELGTMSVRADKLAKFEDTDCTDTPGAWYRFVAMSQK